MCGLIGIVSAQNMKNVVPDLLAGLHRLEYRGYDSAGIATNQHTAINYCRVVGNVQKLADLLAHEPIYGNSGIGHVRWATHGTPSVNNAHPIIVGNVAVVHNGIIENQAQLRAELIELGCIFYSDTDTEVLAHMLQLMLKDGMPPLAAISAISTRAHGNYAFLALTTDYPNTLYGYKNQTPLLVASSDDCCYISSDSNCLNSFANQISYLLDGDIIEVSGGRYHIYDRNLQQVNRPIQNVSSSLSYCRGSHPHFMLKEILEQPEILRHILKLYCNQPFPNASLDLTSISRIKIIGCGSSYCAGYVAKYWFEALLSLPISVEIASEFSYSEEKVLSDCLYIFISQSGETADSIAALKKIQNTTLKPKTLAIVNVANSTISRLCNHHILTHAGNEVSVAATKSFSAQLMVLAILALRCKGTKDEQQELSGIVEAIQQVLADAVELDVIAQVLAKAQRVLYIGRGALYPIAMEGSLKMRETTYIAAFALAAGELKHGTIALVDDYTPVIVLSPSDALFDKTASNVHSISARGSMVQLLSDVEGAATLTGTYQHTFILPRNINMFASVFAYNVALQLLAYKSAVLMGLDVDKPRNLAKTVTVE